VPTPDPYGTDLLLDQATGDLIVTPAGGYATVTGPDNVVQALQLRLRTYPGELTMHPEYGNPIAARLVGAKSSDAALAQALANQAFQSAIAGDARMLRARDITAEQDPDAPERVLVAGTIELAAGGALDVADLSAGDATVAPVVDDDGTVLDVTIPDDLDDPFDDDDLDVDAELDERLTDS
jgi:phage baseplate assembly protein W